MTKVLVIALLISIRSTSYCQDTILITPGSKLLQSGQIKNYKASYDFISYKDGAEKKVGGIKDDFQIIVKDNKELGLRICNISFGTNTILDSGLCFLNGLKPIYHRTIQTKKRLNINFNNEVITGTVATEEDEVNKNEIISYVAPIPLFDSYYEDIIAKTIQFKKGLLFKFAEYIYERGGTVWSYGEIIGKEKIETKNGGTDVAWKVILSFIFP